MTFNKGMTFVLSSVILAQCPLLKHSMAMNKVIKTKLYILASDFSGDFIF